MLTICICTTGIKGDTKIGVCFKKKAFFPPPAKEINPDKTQPHFILMHLTSSETCLYIETLIKFNLWVY